MDKPLSRKLPQPKPKLREYANATASFNRQEIERELTKLEGTYCPTPADKYHILLKRDGLLSKLRTKTTDVKEAKNLTASCPDMCPEKERYCRLVGNLLDSYECSSDGKLNHALAVKDYSRSAADQEEPLPHELRPPDVLQKTMDYLILKVDRSMARSELSRWYDFTWSRTRAIRKEITQQMIVDEVTVSLVEKCARFHIYASFCMANFEVKDFDEQMNTENLSKCLQTLRHMYDDLARKSVFCASESEFRAYDTLLNLADSNVLSVTHTYHKNVRDAPLFKLAMKLACAYQTDNYVAFFGLIRQKATYLQACLCHSYFGRIRAKALHTMLKSIRPPKIPTSTFTNILAFNNDEDTHAFMNALEMYPEADDMIRFGEEYQLFSEVSDEKTNYGCRVIEEKLREPLSTIIAGGPCTAPVFSKPVDSFVSDYYGKVPNNPTPIQKLTGLAQSSSVTSSQSSSFKSIVSSITPNGLQPKPPSVPTINNQSNSVSASFMFKSVQKPQSSISSVPQFPSLFKDTQKPSSSGVPTAPTSLSGFGDQAQKSSRSQFPSTFHDAQSTSSLDVSTTPQFPAFLNNTQQSATNSLKNSSTTPQFPTGFSNLQQPTRTLSLVPEEPTIDLPSDFGHKTKTRLIDSILNFCVDDFIWLAVHEVRRREKERLLEAREEIIKKKEQKIPEFGRQMKAQLFKGTIDFCIDDILWYVAIEARKQESKVASMLQKHNLRIVKPYANRWIDAMKFKKFYDSLPELTNSGTRKRQSTAFDEEAPNEKRSKKFTPLKFSTKF